MEIEPGRVLILSGYTAHIKSLGDLTRYNHTEYAARHGYGYRCHHSGFNLSRAPTWSKIQFAFWAMKEADESGRKLCDFIFWIDADAIFTNFEKKIEPLIHGMTQEERLLMGEDSWGINAGLWILRNDPWSEQFLLGVWHSDPAPLVEKGIQPPIWIEQPRYMCEQSTIWHWLNIKNELQRIKLIPYFELGGYLEEFDNANLTPPDQAMKPPTQNAPIHRRPWREGDFALHLAGVPAENRMEAVKDILSRLKLKIS